MTIRPITLLPHEVRGIKEGRQTQIRRLLKPQPEPWKDFHLEGGCQRSDWSFETGTYTDDGKRYRFGLWMHCAFHESRFLPAPFAPGDVLWCRETWLRTPAGVAYAADGGDHYGAGGRLRWRSPATMPRWASRTTLTVTDVRCQRIQEISEDDARAEGVLLADAGGALCYRGYEGAPVTPSPGVAFRDLWDFIHGPGAFDRNPWVFAYSFTAELRNVDDVKGGAA